MRAVQGHSRSDVHDDDLLERCTEETLPGVLLHGTKWHLYEAIRDQGILPQALLAQEQGRTGKARRVLKDVDTSTSSPRKIEGRTGCQASVRMPLW